MAKAKNTPATENTATPAEPVAEVVKIAQNGITRPKDGTTTGRVWEIADAISEKNGAPADRKTVIEQVVAENINASTGATQYGKWRKFHGLIGEASPGRAAKPKADAAPAAPAPIEETGE